MIQNRVKAKLNRGEAVFGCMTLLLNPAVVELLGLAGFDYVCIDGEHGPLDRQTLENLVRAAEIRGVTPIFRTAVNHPEEILPLLDTGVQGIMVPHVNTVENAQAAVDAVKYAPLGKRGMTPGRASSYATLKPTDYITQANQESLVVIQIEEMEAVENLPDLLEVEGIDIYTIGPGDLAHSMGRTGQKDHPELLETINYIVDTVVAAGKHVGTAAPLEKVPEYYERGAREFAWSDGRLLLNAGQDVVGRAVQLVGGSSSKEILGNTTRSEI